MDDFPGYNMESTTHRRKISDQFNYCSLEKCDKHHDRHEDDYNKALENFKYYKTLKSTINMRFEKTQKLRYLIIPVILFLIVIRTFSSTNPTIQNSVSLEKVKSFWRNVFLSGKEITTIDTLDMLMAQMYNTLFKALHINDFLYVTVNYEPIELQLSYANLGTSEWKRVSLQKRFDFDRTNITSVLNLPFDLNDEKKFKNFSAVYDTVILGIKNVVYCVDLLGTRDCLQSNVRIDFINKGFQYLAIIRVDLLNYIEGENGLLIQTYKSGFEDSANRLQAELPARQKAKQKVNRRRLIRDSAANFESINSHTSKPRSSASSADSAATEGFKSLNVNVSGDFPLHFYDFFKQNKLIIILILLISTLALILDLAIYYVVILDHKLEKSFELKLILLNQETAFQDNLFSLPRKKISVWLLLSIFKNIVTMFFCLTNIFPELPISSRSLLPHSIQLLVWVSMVELINNNKNFGLILTVFKNAFQHYTKSFIGYITLAIAFIVSATLIFQTSEKYLTFSDAFFTIFSLMVGDSVLDIFDDLKSYGMFGTLFMICCILFFVFMIQSLYITIITDSFFTLIDNDESKAKAEAGPVNEKMAESQIKEAQLTNRSEFAQNIPEESKEYDSILKNESGIRNDSGVKNISALEQENYSKGESIVRERRRTHNSQRGNLSIDEEDKEENFSYVINTEEGSPSAHEIQLMKVMIPPLRLEKNIYGDQIPALLNHQNSSFNITFNDLRRLSTLPNQAKMYHKSGEDLASVPVEIEENTDIELFNLQQKRLQEIDKTRLKNELEMVNKMKRLIQTTLGAKKSDDRLMFHLCLEFIIAKVKKQTKNIQKIKNHI